jgi:hypothetical protein
MNQVDWNTVASYARGIWAVAGPLIGVLIGAYVANRNQRKHWIADNKKEEYREVLVAMNKTIAAYINAKMSADNLTAWHQANPQVRTSLAETMESRIFIAPVLKRLELDKKFFAAFDTVPVDKDFPSLLKQVDGLCDELRDAASKDIGI